jgi:hypothetical protein
VQPLIANREAQARVFSFDEDGFGYPWKGIAKAAGVKLFHSFRRTSARDKRAVDTPGSVIMEEMGWTSEAIFRRYAFTTRNDKLKSQQKLEEFQAETRTKAAQNQRAQPQATNQVQ